MGKVKSIRFNDRIERMFNVLKEYYSKTGAISDTEIITRGIEAQYDDVSTELNNLFAKKMLAELSNNMYARGVFEKLCNMLEILSVSQGSLLQDEFWCFLKVNVEESVVYNISDGEKELVNKQYEKIYDTLLKGYDEKDLNENGLNELKQIFDELYGNEYREKK